MTIEALRRKLERLEEYLRLSNLGILTVRQPTVRLTKNANQSAQNSYLTWETEDFDEWGMHDAVNNTRITIPEDGKYLFGCTAIYDGSGAGTGGQLLIGKNRASWIGGTRIFIDAVDSPLNVGGMANLQKGDYLEVYVDYWTTVHILVNLTIAALSIESDFWCRKVE